MAITEIEAKSVLRKHKKIESWFVSRYGMNLYRGCTHNCVYCDGRAEGYYVGGEFGADVAVKINALEILRREFDSKRKRTPFKLGFVMVGRGGYNDRKDHPGNPGNRKLGILRAIAIQIQRTIAPG